MIVKLSLKSSEGFSLWNNESNAEKIELDKNFYWFLKLVKQILSIWNKILSCT